MISREICSRVLQAAVATGADYAELFAENTLNHSIQMIASKVDSINDGVIAGADILIENLDTLCVNTGLDGIYSENGNITLETVSGAITAGEGYAAWKSDASNAVITVNGNEIVGEIDSGFAIGSETTQEG